jgi:hypothetical protein
LLQNHYLNKNRKISKKEKFVLFSEKKRIVSRDFEGVEFEK